MGDVSSYGQFDVYPGYEDMPTTPITEEQLLAYAAHWSFRQYAVDVNQRRGGGIRCVVCGLQYYDHPKRGPVDSHGDPFLNALCTGELVKL